MRKINVIETSTSVYKKEFSCSFSTSTGEQEVLDVVADSEDGVFESVVVFSRNEGCGIEIPIKLLKEIIEITKNKG